MPPYLYWGNIGEGVASLEVLEILENLKRPVLVVDEHQNIVKANSSGLLLYQQYNNLEELLTGHKHWSTKIGKYLLIELDDLPIPKRILAENAEYLLDLITDGIHIVDKNGVTIFYNRSCEELDGISRQEALGRSILEIYPHLDKEKSTFFQVLRNKKELLNHENCYISIKGKQIRAISSTIPLFSEDQVVGAAEIVHNIKNIEILSESILELQDRLVKSLKGKKRKKKLTGARYTFSDLVGKNKEFRKAVELAEQAAKTDLPILIYGETGTGKEMFAQSIHNSSAFWEGPFVAVNCAAIPDNLLESMLFGTVKGAFTGAQDRAGLLEHAAGGTIFFDEVQSLSTELQAKLLRVLQEGTFRRVGDITEIPLQARVISAMNIPPEKAIKEGLLREDLYYRLCVFRIMVPPLRERKDDLPLLVEHFLNRYNRKTGKKLKGVTPETMKLFYAYSWPGNVRELEHILLAHAAIAPPEATVLEIKQEAFGRTLQPQIKHPFDKPLPEVLKEVERKYILQCLKANNYNISRTARKLGVTRQSLQYRMKRLRIQVKREVPSNLAKDQ